MENYKPIYDVSKDGSLNHWLDHWTNNDREVKLHIDYNSKMSIIILSRVLSRVFSVKSTDVHQVLKAYQGSIPGCVELPYLVQSNTIDWYAISDLMSYLGISINKILFVVDDVDEDIVNDSIDLEQRLIDYNNAEAWLSTQSDEVKMHVEVLKKSMIPIAG